VVATDPPIAVVTGAASGIGRAIALRLAESKVRVAVADLDEAGSAETVDLVQGNGGTAAAFKVDISAIDAVKQLREEVRERFGIATILVNNAGWDLGMPFLTTTPEFWSKVVGINYLGTVAICHTFLSDMVEAQLPGHVVNIGSDAGRVGSMGETVYAGAKGAVIAFTKSLAREMARHRINVNCVCPGPTNTKLFYQQPEKVREAVVRAIPFKRLGEPEELAAAVAFLCSDDASFITGQVLSVSGGLTMNG
jgi:2-hydroxycyclohexanecarboxyl-CoA dehydrogenase